MRGIARTLLGESNLGGSAGGGEARRKRTARYESREIRRVVWSGQVYRSWKECHSIRLLVGRLGFVQGDLHVAGFVAALELRSNPFGRANPSVTLCCVQEPPVVASVCNSKPPPPQPASGPGDGSCRWPELGVRSTTCPSRLPKPFRYAWRQCLKSVACAN